MRRVDGLDHLTSPAEGSVVTIGFFDGVHLGHRAVLDRTVARARERGLPSTAITFDRHPREVLTPGSEPRLLSTVEGKARLIAARGIDELLVLPFTADLAAWEPDRFVHEVLVTALRARHVVVGDAAEDQERIRVVGLAIEDLLADLGGRLVAPETTQRTGVFELCGGVHREAKLHHAPIQVIRLRPGERLLYSAAT